MPKDDKPKAVKKTVKDANKVYAIGTRGGFMKQSGNGNFYYSNGRTELEGMLKDKAKHDRNMERYPPGNHNTRNRVKREEPASVKKLHEIAPEYKNQKF